MKVVFLDGVFKHVRESTGEVITVDKNFIVTPPGVHIKELLKGPDSDFYYELNNACAGYNEDLKNEIEELRYEASFENEVQYETKTKTKTLTFIEKYLDPDQEKEIEELKKTIESISDPETVLMLTQELDRSNLHLANLQRDFQDLLNDVYNHIDNNPDIKSAVLHGLGVVDLTAFKNSIDNHQWNNAFECLKDIVGLFEDKFELMKIADREEKFDDFLQLISERCNGVNVQYDRIKEVIDNYREAKLVDYFKQRHSELLSLIEWIMKSPHMPDCLNNNRPEYNPADKNYKKFANRIIKPNTEQFWTEIGYLLTAHKFNEVRWRIIDRIHRSFDFEGKSRELERSKWFAGLGADPAEGEYEDIWNRTFNNPSSINAFDETIQAFLPEGWHFNEDTINVEDPNFRFKIAGAGKKYEELSQKVNSMIYLGAILFILIFIALVVVTVRDSNTEFKISYSRKIPKHSLT